MSKNKGKNEDVIAYYIAESTYTTEPTVLKTTKNIVKFEAILQEADVENRNKRRYPLAVLQEAWRSPRVQEKLLRKTMVCEAGHPQNGNMARLSDIDYARACCIIKDYRFENALLYGTVETIDNELGRTMKSMILDNGSLVSFSLRGFGAMSKRPGMQNVVESPLNIITYDFVNFPSYKSSVMTKLIEGEQIIPITEQEATDFLLENSEVMNVLQDYLKDRNKKTNIDLNGNVTIFTEQEKLFINVEKHVRDKYFKML